MPTLSLASIRARAKLFTAIGRKAEDTLSQIVAQEVPGYIYDVFFSAQTLDPELILGVKLTLEDYGYKSTFEWPLDPGDARTTITADRANALREKLDHCRCFLFVSTSARTTCTWLPWVLGYCEGRHGCSAVLPIMPTNADIYHGEDYLDIYPYISSFTLKTQKSILVVMHRAQVYCTFEDWLRGSDDALEAVVNP